jgi:hypothetical protein
MRKYWNSRGREVTKWTVGGFVVLWILLVSVQHWSLWTGAAASAPVLVAIPAFVAFTEWSQARNAPRFEAWGWAHPTGLSLICAAICGALTVPLGLAYDMALGASITLAVLFFILAFVSGRLAVGRALRKRREAERTR